MYRHSPELVSRTGEASQLPRLQEDRKESKAFSGVPTSLCPCTFGSRQAQITRTYYNVSHPQLIHPRYYLFVIQEYPVRLPAEKQNPSTISPRRTVLSREIERTCSIDLIVVEQLFDTVPRLLQRNQQSPIHRDRTLAMQYLFRKSKRK
jgi:hypothetical protein